MFAWGAVPATGLAIICLGNVPNQAAAPRERGEKPAPRPSEQLDKLNERPGDLLCGPRCVQYLLEYYGRDREDLIALARECQRPDLEAGASLDALGRALKKRGIHVFAMSLAPDARLKWPFPVLMHLDLEGHSVGHYVVWLPSSAPERVDLWCGLSGTREPTEKQMARLRSGAVLLTAPEAITHPEAAVERAPQWNWTPWVCAGAIALLLTVAFRRKVFRSVVHFLRPLDQGDES